MIKPLIISDKNSKSLKIKREIKKIFKKNQLKKKNIIIVIGGDGFMLKTLKKNTKTKRIIMLSLNFQVKHCFFWRLRLVRCIFIKEFIKSFGISFR